MNADIFTDAEVLAVLNRSMRFVNGDYEKRKIARRRAAKADFCNIKGQEVIFMEL